jgi:cytochrome c-type biogenesis protein CcsB
MFTPLENFLSNFSFLTLFLSMLIYWVEISNFTLVTPSLNLKQNPTLVGSMSSGVNSYSESQLKTWNNKLSKKGTSTKNLGQIGIIISNVSIFILLVLRWKESGHFPLSNLYESLMFLAWTLTTIHLLLEFNIFGLNFGNTPFMAKLIGSITTPSALFTNAFATFSLPKEMQEASPLVPALQSNWLMMHVTVMILSYGALICGSLLAIAFLIITGVNKNNGETKIHPNGKESELTNSDVNKKEGLNSSENKIEKLAMTFDNLSYRILGIGFPLLTIGILSGAVWANEAWGSYWSWDPKETWALLTWLVFAIYLHTRLNKGWQGKKPALIASLGFISVWICYLGVNLLGEGLHSYGWFQ